MSDTIVYPDYFRILECRSGRWFIKNLDTFYGTKTVDHEDIKALFGVTEQQVIVELFRINGGASGHYLANLREQRYYYCVDREGVKKQLLELGIGQVDPLEKNCG